MLAPATNFEEAEIRGALKKLACVTMREIVEMTGERTDGRKVYLYINIEIEIKIRDR